MNRPPLPEVALDDPFGPPATPVEATCIHCGKRVNTANMWWNPVTELWMCPTPGCDGAG